MTAQPVQGADLLEGVYQTPLELLRAVHRRWPICFDLAANDKNQVVKRLGGRSGYFYSEDENAFCQPWTNANRNIQADKFCFLNPPFGDIGSWTEKAKIEADKAAKIVMLLPSATGASWLDCCWGRAHIVFLVGRPVFEFINPMTHKNEDKRGKPNTDPYGKDMLLVVFGEGVGQTRWDWRK